MKAPSLQISQRQLSPGVAVISLAGKIMLGQASAAIEEQVNEALKAGQKKIIVELSGVTHIDSTGIGRFIASLGQVTAAGGTLVMAGATGVVREGFRVTRLDSVFRFFPDVESAARALG